MDGSVRAHLCHLVNTIELVHPSAQWSPQPKRQIDRLSRSCTADGRVCLYFTMGAPMHRNCPGTGGSGPLSNAWCLRPMWAHNPNGTLVQLSLHRWLYNVPVLYNGSPISPSKLPFFMEWSGSHVIHGSFAHPSPEPKWQLYRFSRFAGLTTVTDSQTDRQTTLLGR